jgi:RNA polymerase sigma factor (sigma-70 family)
MASEHLDTVLRQLRRLIGPREADALSDGQLLQRFALRREEEAFALLVQRHGPMVLGVCRRVLRHEHDADDAFQATFLILARKASSIRRHGSVGSWLYRVALRVALSAKTQAVQRPLPVEPTCTRFLADPAAEAAWRELRPVLDQEVRGLPEKYRLPVVLCYLEGKTHEAAAAELGWPLGSVAGRLSRARDLLRRRLTRRGVVLSAGSLTTLLGSTAAAALPEALIADTIKAAVSFAAPHTAEAGAVSARGAALAKGVLHAMFLTRLKVAAAVVLVLALIAGGAGMLALGTGEAEEPGKGGVVAAPQAEEPKPSPPVVKDGLEITIRPLRAVFTPKETVEVEVRLKNASDQPLRLYYPSVWINPFQRFLIEDLKTGRRWTYALIIPAEPVLLDRKFAPGEALVSKATMYRFFTVPPPGDAPREQERLAAGEYRVQATIELQANPQPQKERYWSGEITSAWATFKIADMPVRPKEAGPGAQAQAEHEQIVGTWRLIDAEQGGRDTTETPVQDEVRWIITKEEIHYEARKKTSRFWRYRLDPGQQPTTLDLTILDGPDQGKTLLAVCAVAGGRLKVCVPQDYQTRPTELRTRPGTPWVMYTFERESPATPKGGKPKVIEPLTKEAAEYASIGVMTPSGWHLNVGPDGGGNYGYGSHFPDFVQLPPGTFPFSTLVKDLKARTKAEGSIPKFYSVALRRHGETTTYAVYTADAEYVGKLFATAKAASTKSLGNRIEALWSRYPPTPHNAAAWRLRPRHLHPAGGVKAMALSPDGKLAATGEGLRLWDLATGQEVPAFKERWGAQAVAFSPDGKLLATGARDSPVKLWDVPSGKLVATRTGHSQSVEAVAFSPDGKLLATASQDRTAHLWDVASGKELAVCAGHVGKVTSVAFSPDGKLLATGGEDRNVHLWDVATAKEVHRFARHRDPVRAVAFSPDGKLLATASQDKTIQLWDMATKELIRTLRGHTGAVFALAFTSDGKSLASGSADQTVRVCSVAGNAEPIILGQDSAVVSLAFSRDGALLAVGTQVAVMLREANKGANMSP